MTSALAILMILISGTQAEFATEPVKMSIDQCLSMAREINSDATTPYFLVCAPDLSVNSNDS